MRFDCIIFLSLPFFLVTRTTFYMNGSINRQMCTVWGQLETFFQLCLFNEAVPEYETISSTLPQCAMRCVLRAHAQFCRYDMSDATADVQ